MVECMLGLKSDYIRTLPLLSFPTYLIPLPFLLSFSIFINSNELPTEQMT